MCWGYVLKIGCFLHRFLISSPDLRIDARISPFTPSCVHRFLISGSNLGIAARLCPFTPSFVQRFRISGQDLRIDAAEKSSACSGRSGDGVRVRFYSSLPQRRMVPPAVVVAATRSASDSILRCRKGEWFRLPQSSRQRRIARLQQSRWVQAGTGCHKGGIILSKKPPKWRLSPSNQRSASFFAAKWNGSACRSRCDYEE